MAARADLARAPRNYCRVQTKNGPLLVAYGRDPYFEGWPDTLQLNYGNPQLQQAMIGELERIAGQCDGVRCDMAMLLLPDVFESTWGIGAELFWPKATESVRRKHPNFQFMAEVYWDREWTLLQQGFDYAYDKRLYDRLHEGHARPVREHFHAGLDYQNKLARFLENHDEPRAAAAFSPDVHEAAAVITFLSPGLRFFHQGQFEGRKKRISPHLVRGPEEPVDKKLEQFYDRLLSVLRNPVVRNGDWQLLECVPAWDGNWTWDCFRGLCLAKHQCRATARGSELCPQPEPVPCSTAVCRSRQQPVAPGGFAQRSALRLERQRSRSARAVRGHGSLASSGFLAEQSTWGMREECRRKKSDEEALARVVKGGEMIDCHD